MRRKKTYPVNDNLLHVYNLLIDDEIHSVDLGWKTLDFELHTDIKDNGVELTGQCIFNENKILLDASLNDSDARETILHEILHCWYEMAGYDESKDSKEYLSLTNERLVDVTTKGLLFLTKLNPKLMRLLFTDVQSKL